MVGKGKLSWSDFKPGTILWAKAIVIIGFVLGLSYLLSKLSFLLGILFYLYIFVFASPGAFFQVALSLSEYSSIILAMLIFPVYFLIFMNYFYLYFKKKKTVWWLTTLFVITTIIYILGIIIGWLTFLVWHP